MTVRVRDPMAVPTALVRKELRRLPPCEICTGPSHKELRGVEDRGGRVRNARSVAVGDRIGCHDPPQSSGGLSGPYGHRLLPVCCSAMPTLGTTV
jgi:hypothetical protein